MRSCSGLPDVSSDLAGLRLPPGPPGARVDPRVGGGADEGGHFLRELEEWTAELAELEVARGPREDLRGDPEIAEPLPEDQGLERLRSPPVDTLLPHDGVDQRPTRIDAAPAEGLLGGLRSDGLDEGREGDLADNLEVPRRITGDGALPRCPVAHRGPTDAFRRGREDLLDEALLQEVVEMVSKGDSVEAEAAGQVRDRLVLRGERVQDPETHGAAEG